MRFLAAIGFSLVFAGPAYALAQSPSQASQLAALMIGSYETAPDDLKNDFIDTRVALEPLGPGEWVYYQLNLGPDREVYRQRVLQLTETSDGGVLQTTWSLKDPESFAVQPSASSLRKDVSMDDLVPALDEGCDQYWRYEDGIEGGPWVGLVDPDTCEIFPNGVSPKLPSRPRRV